MKIVMANKYWYLRRGAERYAFELSRLLEQDGHETVPFAMQDPKNQPTPFERFFVSPVVTDEISFGWQGLRTASRFLYSFEAARKFEALIDETKPDLLHVHNIYHQISPSILAIAKKRGLPAVMSLHDYHLVSPNYAMFDYRRSRIRPPSKRHPFLDTLLRKQVNNSWAASALSAFEGWLHARLKLYDGIRTFIAPSHFMKDICVGYGVPAGKIDVVPHFIDLKDCDPRYESESRVVFVGSLSKEKGVDVLLEAMREVKELQCVIIGDGPDRARLGHLAEAMKLTNVKFAGALYGEALEKEVARALVVVVPSRWYEVFGLIVLEAYAQGKPVIASRIGGLPEVVRDGETGLLCEPSDAADLAAKLRRLAEHPDEAARMGRAGRKLAETEYAPKLHLERIEAIYKKAL